MRNILAFLAAVTLTVGIAGWYLGWYSVRSTTDTTGHRNVNINFDTKKIGTDLKKGAAEVQKTLDKSNETAAEKAVDKAGDKLENLEKLVAPVTNSKIDLPLLAPPEPMHKDGKHVSVEQLPQYRAFDN